MAGKSYDSGYHCKYSLQYHIIWCPKFRYPVLTEGRQEYLKPLLYEICREYRYEIRALDVMQDHIHVFLSAPQTVAPCDIVRTLKSRSAVSMLKDFPDLRKFYSRCGKLWSRGYYVATVGHISEEAVKKYIEEQKLHG